jgi:hypothetical protein
MAMQLVTSNRLARVVIYYPVIEWFDRVSHLRSNLAASKGATPRVGLRIVACLKCIVTQLIHLGGIGVVR